MLRRWAAGRPPTPLRFLGVDEIYLGRRDKFLTIVSDLDTGEPLWAGRDRKRETLDRFFAEALPLARRQAVQAICVDMWEPFTQSVRTHLPHARIAYDKFLVLRNVNDALDETRRAEFFRQDATSATSSGTCSPSTGAAPKRICSKSSWGTSGTTLTKARRGAS